jgi:hypothetical protein
MVFEQRSNIGMPTMATLHSITTVILVCPHNISSMIGLSRCAIATVGCSALRQMCLVLTLLALTMHIITDTGIDEPFVFMSSVIF